MTALFQKNTVSDPTLPAWANRASLLLFFISSAAFAAANGFIELPESYRTPLSDMLYDDNPEWRTEEKEKNPWRDGKEELILKPRIKVELFPEYSPDSSGNPVSNSLFQNEYEVEKPASSFFKYTF